MSKKRAWRVVCRSRSKKHFLRQTTVPSFTVNYSLLEAAFAQCSPGSGDPVEIPFGGVRMLGCRPFLRFWYDYLEVEKGSRDRLQNSKKNWTCIVHKDLLISKMQSSTFFWFLTSSVEVIWSSIIYGYALCNQAIQATETNKCDLSMLISVFACQQDNSEVSEWVSGQG